MTIRADDNYDGITSIEGMQQLLGIPHNKTDGRAFNSFFDRMEARYRERDKGGNTEELLEQQWRARVPARYQSADIRLLESKRGVDKLRKAMQKTMVRDGFVPSFYLAGKEQSGKTFYAYSIIRELHRTGRINLDRMLTISQEDVEFWDSAGFQGKSKLMDMTSSRWQFFLIENLDVGKSTKVWDRFFGHVYNNSLPLVVTSTNTLSEVSKDVSSRTHTRLFRLFPPDYRITFTSKFPGEEQ